MHHFVENEEKKNINNPHAVIKREVEISSEEVLSV